MIQDSAINRWNPADYAANAGFVPALGGPVVDLLSPRPGEGILDLGCGDGALAIAIRAAGANVVGVDASPEMVEAARGKGIDARVMDGEHLDFRDSFDAVFSNAALHWMLDPAAVATGVFRALRAGGRFVGEMGGAGNIALLRSAIRAELVERGYPARATDPQWYPTPDEFRAVYADAGFGEIEAWLIERPTPLPTGITGWLRTFRGGFLDSAGVPDDAQEDVARAVERRLEPVLHSPDGGWFADYVRLRFTMRKPA